MKLLGRGNIVKFGHDAGEDFNPLQRLYREFRGRTEGIKAFVVILRSAG